MKKNVFALLVLSLMSLGPAHLFADEHGHNHEAAVEPAPHGGILRDAPPYKAELVLNKDEAKIYIYGTDLKLANLTATELEGKLKFPKDKKERVVKFVKKAEAFGALISGISKVHRYDLHVALKEAGKTTILDFGVDNIH